MAASVPSELRLIESMIETIEEERARRAKRLELEDAEIANDIWIFEVEPLIAEFCMSVLVALWHHVERGLIWLWARKVATAPTWPQHVKAARERQDYLRRKGETAWGELKSLLKLTSFPDYPAMRTLQLMVNAYKHDPQTTPTSALLTYLGEVLPSDAGIRTLERYAPIAESAALRKHIAVSLGMSDDSDFCEIARDFTRRAIRFLAAIESQGGFPRPKGSVVLLPIFGE